MTVVAPGDHWLTECVGFFFVFIVLNGLHNRNAQNSRALPVGRLNKRFITLLPMPPPPPPPHTHTPPSHHPLSSHICIRLIVDILPLPITDRCRIRPVDALRPKPFQAHIPTICIFLMRTFVILTLEDVVKRPTDGRYLRPYGMKSTSDVVDVSADLLRSNFVSALLRPRH